MFPTLYKYLLLYKKVSIPGIGLFYIDRNPAIFNFSNKEFISPSATIAFNPISTTASDKWLSFLSVEQEIKEEEASRNFNQFGQELQNKLLLNGSVELPKFGLLSKSEAGTIEFLPTHSLPTFFTNVPIEPSQAVIEMPVPVLLEAAPSKEAILEGQTDEEIVTRNKSYWWIAALILAIIAIAAIGYYYYQNGSFK